MGLPESHRFIVKLYEECNYLQALEGTLDPAHPSFLHRELPTDDLGRRVLSNGASYSSEREAFAAQMYQTSLEGAPKIVCEDTPYGFHAAALRHLGDVQYVRITEFVLPFHSAIARGPHEMRDYRTVVPINDQACWAWYIHYDPEKPVDREHALEAWGHRVGPDGRSPANRENMHLQDRERMRAGSFSGIPGVAIQDLAVQESQGPIYDRTTERLGSSDAAIIRLRRVLLRGVHTVKAGQDPPGLDPSLAIERLHAVAIRVPADCPWQEARRRFDEAVAAPR
jgi:phthalate 4,5-dioxygenase oxygenase subunit